MFPHKIPSVAADISKRLKQNIIKPTGTMAVKLFVLLLLRH